MPTGTPARRYRRERIAVAPDRGDHPVPRGRRRLRRIQGRHGRPRSHRVRAGLFRRVVPVRMNILLCLSHSIEEYDQLRLLSGLDYGVASIGGYIDPLHPHDPKRPSLDIPMVPEIKAAVDGLGQHDNLGAAQSRLPAVALDWADVIIYHHRLERLFGQWDQIAPWIKAGGRVIWRTVGQSVE